MLELRESHRNAVRDSSTCEIRVGELVMVHNENQRRGLWKLGKVERLVKGEDDKVRSAIVTRLEWRGTGGGNPEE